MRTTLLILALIHCAIIPAASGASYYVSTDGSNANPGTLSQPFRTIQSGINAAVAGDTIFVRALTSGGAQMVYSERPSFVSRNGTASAPITLRNYPGDVLGDGSPAYPAIDQTGVTPPNNVTGLLTITDSSYLTVEGLEFTNYITADEAKTPAGIFISGRGTGVRLVRDKVHHIYQNNAVLLNVNANGFGIAVYGTNAAAPIDALVIDSCEVYDLRTGQSETIVLNGNVTNFQVINNHVHDCNNIGIDCVGFEQVGLSDTVDFARSGLIRGNRVHDIDSQFNPGYGGNFSGSFPSQSARNDVRAAPGIYIDGGASIIVERNDVHDCNIGISLSSEALNKVTASCLVRDNLIRRNHVGGLFLGGSGTLNGGTQNCFISNNTFYQNDTENIGGGSVAIQHFVTGTTLKQNIFVCGPLNRQFILKTSSDGSFSTNAINWNLYSGTSSTNLEFVWNGTSRSSFAAWQSASAQDANSLFVASSSALFVAVSPVNDVDFFLTATSPAFNAGDPTFVTASGETSYSGRIRLCRVRVDIGMDEFSSGPGIKVEQPVGTILVPGASVIDFGTVLVPHTEVRTFTLTNTGSGDLTGLVITKDGVNAADYLVSGLSSAPPIVAGGSTTFTVTFAPLVQGVRSARLHIASNALDPPVFDISLTGIAKYEPVSISTQPASASAAVGTGVTFTVIATGTPALTYQWRKNAINIIGATTSSYTIPSVVLTSSGAYSVVVRNIAGALLSGSAVLSVGDTTAKFYKMPTGATAVMPTSFAGSISSYLWRKNSGPLPSDPRYVGGTTSKLSISALRVALPDDSGSYTCEASIASGNLTATAILIVYSLKPEITLPPSVPHTIIMPTAMVGDTYSAFQIPFNNDPLKTPTAFAATGLPAGLSVATATGIITGRPVVALVADKEYAIKFTASNAKGSSVADASLLVKALPYGAYGTFVAPLARSVPLNKNLGGRFDLIVSTSAAFSGRVTLGIAAYAFVGKLETDVSGVVRPHGSIVIKRTAPALPLTINFDLDAAINAIINGDLTDQSAHLAFNGWRKKWGTVMPLAELFDLRTYPGYYTFALDIPAAQNGNIATPQGMGYGAFTIASTGTLGAAGKLADGTAYTSAAFCGPHGEVLVFQALYASLGSVIGTLDITQGTSTFVVPLYSDSTLGGTMSWLRPATLTHIYKLGVGPINLSAGGGRYVAPVAPALLFEVIDNGSTNNARLVFTEGGINDTATSPNVNLRIKAGGLVVIPVPNLRLVTLAITQSTGYFTGKATLTDSNPAVPGATITRTPIYYGMIVRDGSVMRGYGFFLLPQRPSIPTQTVLTTEQLSGQVVLEKFP